MESNIWISLGIAAASGFVGYAVLNLIEDIITGQSDSSEKCENPLLDRPMNEAEIDVRLREAVSKLSFEAAPEGSEVIESCEERAATRSLR